MAAGQWLSSPRVLRAKYSQKVDEKKAPPSAKRGAVTGLSKDSRRRLSILLASLVEVSTWHITLTWGATYPDEPAEVKRVIHSWGAVARRLGHCGVWRLEWQKRGAPHFHVLILGDLDPSQESSLVAAWARISGNGNVHGADVRPAVQGKAAWYLALHQSKGGQHISPDWWRGRVWGYIDRESVVSLTLTKDIGQLGQSNWEFVWLFRLYRRYLKSNGRFWNINVTKGLTWFLPQGEHSRVVAYVNSMAASHGPLLEQDPF